VKKNDFRPRYGKFLDKLKLSQRAKKTDNKLLAVVDLTHSSLSKPTRTRRAQLIAAALHFGRRPSELRKGSGGEGQAIRAWKEETGRVRPSRKTPKARDIGRPSQLVEGEMLALIQAEWTEGGWSFNVKCAVPTSDERTVDLVETLHDLVAHPTRDDDDFDGASADAEATEPDPENHGDVQTAGVSPHAPATTVIGEANATDVPSRTVADAGMPDIPAFLARRKKAPRTATELLGGSDTNDSQVQ
jgi:hypothetical protein